MTGLRSIDLSFNVKITSAGVAELLKATETVVLMIIRSRDRFQTQPKWEMSDKPER